MTLLRSALGDHERIDPGLGARVPSLRIRLALTLLIGLSIGLAFAFGQRNPTQPARDLAPVLQGAREVLAGRSPFLREVAPDGTGPRMLYPMPAYLALIPLAGLDDQLARAVWSGLAIGLLTWVSLRRWGLDGIAVVFSRPAALAVAIAQWSPFFFVSALAPGWQVLAAAKPSIAFIAWCYRPTRWAILGGIALAGISFIILPSWYAEWRTQFTGVDWYLPAAAVWQGGGPLLLLAALRWRRPEARVLLALALVPHNFAWYDQLLVFLVPETKREVWTLSILSWAGAYAGGTLLYDFDFIHHQHPFDILRPVIVLSLYLPALGMVLRRANEAPRERSGRPRASISEDKPGGTLDAAADREALLRFP